MINHRSIRTVAFAVLLASTSFAAPQAQPAASPPAQAPQASVEFDFLVKGGHVIDPKNGLDAVRDVGVRAGRIAAVASNIAATRALKTVDASGLHVTPGLVDIHVHVFPGEKPNDYAGGDWSVYPDGHTLRTCVTTVADAGTSGWRNFEAFKARIIDPAKTRVLAFINIVGAGMGSGPIEQNVSDMEVEPTAAVALKHKDLIVGIKSAHFTGSEWTPYERAIEVGRQAKIPVMVDFGSNVRAKRTLDELFTKYFRPGDIYTHMYGGNRGEQDPGTKGPSQAMLEGRKRGVLFDVGHGGTSFRWSTAVPLMKAGFTPDTISTDLHTGSMNAAMKDMLNVMGKFLAMGMSLGDVIARSTANPAKAIQRPELGQIAVGAPADLAVLRVERGRFRYPDPRGGLLEGALRLSCEMTVRDGKVVYDLGGLTASPWETLDPTARAGDPRWDNIGRR
jgi:dihydroorotase